MIRKLFMCLFLLFMVNSSVNAQSLLHSVSGEVGGHTAGYGANYDIRFAKAEVYKWGAGIVLGVYAGNSSSGFTSTLRGYRAIGKKSSTLELGASILYSNFIYSISSMGTTATSRESNTYVQGYVGYRYQPLSGGLTARIYLVPISFKFSNTDTPKFGGPPLGIIGVSLGYTFKSNKTE